MYDPFSIIKYSLNILFGILSENNVIPPDNLEILGELNYPTPNAKIRNLIINVQGWALSRDGNEVDILIFVDDEMIDKTKTGVARLDVEKNFPNIKNSYESGFNYQLIVRKNFKWKSFFESNCKK